MIDSFTIKRGPNGRFFIRFIKPGVLPAGPAAGKIGFCQRLLPVYLKTKTEGKGIYLGRLIHRGIVAVTQ
jgi:hypothetical protein